MGSTDTSNKAAMQRSMDYIATNSTLLTGAYLMSAWAGEVKIQGNRMDVIELVRVLGLAYDDDHTTDTGVVIATYRGVDGDIAIDLAVCYSPMLGQCDVCDDMATAPHPKQDHYLTPKQAAHNDRESFQAVTV
ncbi:hypothetical protein [Phycicoccus avicenniae]|uniref:hypothetical protein n=1 Tax=Phycicoccus avicenniae TaxID=2828860 RepID=UPI003D2DB6F4